MRVRSVVLCMVGCGLMVLSGCASLAEHRRVQAHNRSLAASREAMARDLLDARTANESLRTQLTATEHELDVNTELISNLRRENEVLDEMRRLAQSELEKVASRQSLRDLTVLGPRLPEQLHHALQGFARQHPDSVEYDAEHGTVKWKADLLFPFASDVLKETSTQALREFAELLRSSAAADFEMLVVGHTDNVPISRPATRQKHASNWHLSAHRAISVANVLQQNGYPAERIGIMGYGEYRPVADNGTAAGSSKNRRVEIYFVPRGSIVADAFHQRSRTDGARSDAGGT